MARTARSRTRLDPEERRRQIVAAAATVFAGRDPTDVTFEEVADAAGVSRALVYNYFGDRGGLLAAVYLDTFAQLNARLNHDVPRSLGPAERIQRIVHGYLTFAAEHAATWRLLQSTAAAGHPAVTEARGHHLEALSAAWGGVPEARFVGAAVLGLLEAATADWLLTGAGDADHMAEVLFTLLWRGLSAVDGYGIAPPPQRPKASVPT